MRTSKGISRSPPTGRALRSCNARNSLACIPSGMSPISSRKSVPPEAWTNRPARSERASVKAPRAWPKSSLSSNASGMAAQLIATNGPVLRAPSRCSARAELLAGAALTGDEHRGVRVGDLREQRMQLLHRRAFADHLVEAMALGERLAQAAHLLPQRAVLHGARERQRQRLDVDGLGDEVVGARANGADSGLEAAKGGDDDDGHIRAVGHDSCAQLEAIHGAHVQVG